MKNCVCFIFMMLLCQYMPANTPVWSKTGHRVIGEVAEAHLNNRTKKAIRILLNGQSLAAVSNFGDEIKADRSYLKFSPWHYVNFPEGKRYKEVQPSPEGDVVHGIRECIRILKSKDSRQEDRIFYLKILVHLVGDLHQPMHAGRLADKGGNDIQLQWFGRGSNLHKLWDTDMINDYGMSYTELAGALPVPSARELNEIQSGDLLDWVEESHALANELYGSVKVGEKLGYAYGYKHWGMLEQQLLKGGLRLARVLNDIFS